MLQSFTALARGEEPPEPVGVMSLADYAPQMPAPHRMDLLVSAMQRTGAGTATKSACTAMPRASPRAKPRN